MLGQPVSMLLPEVIGFKLTGKLKEGVTATDLVLTVTQMLRKKGVVGKFVEFFGPGLDNMTLADRATIGNMAPGIWRDLRLLPGRCRDDRLPHHVRPRRQTASRWSRPIPRRRACGATRRSADPVFTDTLELDLGDVVPSMAGPKRPEGRVALEGIAAGFAKPRWRPSTRRPAEIAKRYAGRRRGLRSRPWRRRRSPPSPPAPTPPTRRVLIGAGLLARNAVAKGLKQKPWVKTSLAPGIAGRRRISRRSPACRRISTSSASTSSASAAPPASAIPARCRRRSRRPSTTRA